MLRIKYLLFACLLICLSAGVKAQSGSFPPLNSSDSLACSRMLDEFRINFRSGYYPAAYREWQKAYKMYPSFSVALYIEGTPLMDTLIEKESDKVRKQILIDSLMKLYDDRMHYFGRDGYVMGRKAIEMYNYMPARVVEANAMLKRSIELESASTRPAVFVFYMSTMVEMVYSGKADTNELYAAYDLISKNVLEAIRVNQPEGNIYSSAFRNAEDYMRPFTKCNDYNNRFSKQYQADSNNIKELNSMFKTLMEHKCYTSAFCKKLAKRVYSFDSLGEGCLTYGKYLFNSGDVNKSLKYFYLGTKFENKDLAVRSFLAMGDSYKFMDVSPRARNMARKALELQPNNGSIYIYLGDTYWYTFEECGLTDMEKRSVYWVAADMYTKAMEVDPSVKAIAEKRLIDCNINFPSPQMLKRHGLKEGDTYKVPCWIGEETKVRARK